MASEDSNKLNRIEELKTKLFSRNYHTKIEHRDNFSQPNMQEVRGSWEARGATARKASEKFFMKTSVFKKLFIFSFIFFVLALGYAAFTFFSNGNTVSNDNIDISILGNAFTAGGEELPLQVGITNRNNSPLDLVDLVVENPKNGATDLTGDVDRQRLSIGTIPAGGIANENVKVTLYGEQGSVLPVQVSIEYRVEGSNAIFVKDAMYQVTINATPIDLAIDTPPTASPNQDMTLNVKATVNATNPVSNILVKVDYPPGFEFDSSVPAPAFGNDVWSLGDLAPGVSQNISITGKMVDATDGEQKTFKVSTGTQSDTDKSAIGTVFNSLGQTVTIQNPVIDAELYINGAYQSSYASYTNTPIHAQIKWSNNLDTKIDDMQIVATITGNALDKGSIDANEGFYNSSQNTITWDKNSVSNFQEINPGDTGSVDFSFSPVSLFSGTSGILANPSINVEVDISGKQALEGSDTKDLSNSESSVINIISDAGLATQALYYSGPFKNTGPVPPKVDTPTTYTVTWSLSNTANNISKAAVTATLPSWVDFANQISPSTENLTYDSSTKQITWDIGDIPKGAGITTTGEQVSFVVTLTPSLSQLNTAPVIINDAVLTGHDDFANVDIQVNKAALTTNLSNDPQFPEGGDRVTQ